MKDSSSENFEITIAQLRKVEFQQKAILDNIPDIAWLKDLQGKFIAVNEPFAKSCGYRVEEIIGKTDLDIWPKDLGLSYRADDQEVIQSKKRKCVQERLMSRDKGEQWIETIKTPFFDDQGKVIGTTGIARNITLQKNEEERLKEIRAELELRVKVRTAELTSTNENLRQEIKNREKVTEALRISEERFKIIFSNSNVGMLIADVTTRKFILSNLALQRMIGYSQEELVGLGVESIHAKEDLPLVIEKFNQVNSGEIIHVENLPVIKKNKSTIYVDIVSTPLLLNGRRCVLGSFIDVSSRRNNEMRTLDLLSLQKATLEASTDGILVVDLAGKVVSYNQKFVELWRIPENLISLGDDQKLLKFVLDQLIDPEAFMNKVKQLYAYPQDEVYDILRFKDGRVFERLFMTQKSEGAVIGRVWSFRDVTQRVNYENELKVYQDNLEILVEQRTKALELEMETVKRLDKELRSYHDNLERLVEERTKELLDETVRYKNEQFEKNKLNRELIKINEKLKSVSLIDEHTGLYNYRFLKDAIEVEYHKARRYAQNLTVIMLDIDYFKSINDVYGIVFGDLVLKQFAKQLKRMVRRYDILVRYSGEEFIVITSRLNRSAGIAMAQRLLETLNFINFGDKNHKVKLKISFSVASFPDDRAKNGIDLVNSADRLLNKAKESGGNRVYSALDISNSAKKGRKKAGIKTLTNTINKLNKQSKQGLSESIFAFAKTLELKDHYTGEHVENTVHFALGVANELNLPKEDVELIKEASMLHDLGKIGISESILLKKGKLNKKEFDEIKKHPQIGADIIRPIQFLHGLVPLIFYHHERWDGKGYPSGIKGEDIPLGARVIAIADVYQALTSDRPYHKAFSKSAAIDIIKKSSGTQFDPRIVNAFLAVVKREK